MALRLAYWNCTLGQDSDGTKKDLFQAWCAWAQPDMLFLIETGATFFAGNGAHDAPALSGLTAIEWVNTLDVNFKPTPKCLGLLGSGRAVTVFDESRPRAASIPAQRRMMLLTNVEMTSGDALRICAIHANASDAGGLAAVQYAMGRRAAPGFLSLYGGDFNCGAGTAGGHAANGRTVRAPQAYDGTGLNFSQWNWEGHSPVTWANAHMTHAHIVRPPPFSNVNVTRLSGDMLSPNQRGCIDYIITDLAGADVAAAPNCQNENQWYEILKWFDHGPVIYDIAGVTGFP
jgi:hypothetical protein